MAELVIQNPSITSGDFSFSGDAITAIAGHPVAGVGGGGTQSDYVYVPSFDDQTGDITFTLGMTGSEGKGPWHISGAQGPQGPSGTNGKDGTNGYSVELQSVTDEDGGKKVTLSWGETPSTSSFVIPSGAKGADGQKGADGFSPEVSTTTITDGERTGTEITFTFGEGGLQTTSYSAWNGKDGTGASYDFDSSTISGDGSVNSKYGLDTTAAMNLTHTSAYSAIHAADALSSTSAFWAVKAKYGENREYDIGKNLYDLSQWQTYIVNWTETITGDRGIEVLDVDEDGYPDTFQLTDEAWSAVSSVSAKSHTTINSDQVVTTENNGTSATVSAAQYITNDSFGTAPKQLFVCQDDNDLTAHLNICNGKGTLFFVCSAI